MEVLIDKNGMYEIIYKNYYIIKEVHPIIAIPKGKWHHNWFAWKLPHHSESKQVWHDFGYNMVDSKPCFSTDTYEELKEIINARLS